MLSFHSSRTWRGAPLRAAVAAVFVVLLAVAFRPGTAAELQTLEIATKTGVHTFMVEMAVTDEEKARGLQAFRVLSMDDSTAVHPAQMPPPRTHVTVTPTSGLERAQVKWFNRLRGFGFLTRGEGTPDIFVHMETLRRFGITELRPGQFVLVRFGPGPKGLMAAEVRPEGSSLGPSSH